jgi:hypothetical protein
MADGLLIHHEGFTHAVNRLMLTSKRRGSEVAKQQMGLVLQPVAKHTPPASQNVTGRKAEMQGRAKVAADIYSLYGTPNDAYDLIAAASPAQASAFYFLKEQGEVDLAAEIVRAVTGKSFAPFDGGTLHKRTHGGRRRRSQRNREVVFFVSKPEDLAEYVREEQSHVMFLASGWADALKALGRSLPYGVGKHNAPGALKVTINDKAIEITAINMVDYGPEVRGIERRILWSMQIQKDKLDRQWANYLQTAAREAGFKTR